ncbi:M48 family metalloprotease [soil metagenome]
MVRELSALPYHRVVADLLERENPRAFAALLPTGATQGSELDQSLLRSTYRLDAAAHPEAHAALARAAGALGLTVPVELYADENPQRPNAELVFVASRAIVVITGPVLELLDDEELCAVFGHELAHHVLWSADGGRYLAGSRLLDVAEHDARTPSEYLETGRRFRLATELYADRGALLATERLEPAISGLLKVSTGLRRVDPAAYLRQAAEVDFVSTASSGTSHPETVLRAWSLQRWHAAGGESVEVEVARAVGNDLDLTTLDLPGQDRLRDLTRDLVRQATLVEQLRAPEVLELAQRYGAVVAPGPSPLSEISTDDLSHLPSETRRYLCSVLADLATAADDDDRRHALAAALAVGRRKGLGRELLTFLVTELGLGDPARLALVGAADALTDPRPEEPR